MPLIRITLTPNHSPIERQVIADSVHEAIVATIDVPADDRFQIISEAGAAELIYDRGFLGIERSDRFVAIEITLRAGRTNDQKRALYARIVGDITRRTGLRPQDFLIALHPNERIDWSFGDGIAQYVPEG